MIIDPPLPSKKIPIYRRLWFFFLPAIILSALAVAVFLQREVPVFSERQAAAFFTRQYAPIKIRYDESGERAWLPLMRQSFVGTVAAKVLGKLNNDSLPSININVGFEALEQLRHHKTAMRKNSLIRHPQPLHKASIQFNRSKIPVTIQSEIMPSAQQHWSFLVTTRRGKSVFGMKAFSLRHPAVGAFQTEAVALDFAKQLGLLSVRQLFVNVSINGEYIGTMALQELPGKVQLENSGYKAGLIYQFSPSLSSDPEHSRLHRARADEQDRDVAPVTDIYRLGQLYSNALVTPLHTLSDDDSPQVLAQRAMATGLLKGVKQGKIAPNQVFDAQKMGQYFAYLALLGNSQSALVSNASYYFNPYTFRFEPIIHNINADSSHHYQLSPYWQGAYGNELNRILLRDAQIDSAFSSALDKLYEQSKSDDFLQKLRRLEEPYLNGLRREFWALPGVKFETLSASIATVRSALKDGSYYSTGMNHSHDERLVMPPGYRFPIVVDASIVNINGQPHLEIQNRLPLAVRITALTFAAGESVMDGSRFTANTLPIGLNAYYYGEQPAVETLPLSNFTAQDNIHISGRAMVEGQPAVEYEFSAGRSFAALPSHPLAPATPYEISERFPFIHFDKEHNAFSMPPGEWVIDEMILFPEGASLSIGAGVKLAFTERAGMIIRGPLYAIGSETSPIILDAIDSNLATAWSGLTVLQASKKSVLNYVQIKNTSHGRYRQWALPGAVTFYRSDVDIRHSQFIDSIADDALNIAQSEFLISDSLIRGTHADGLGGDFSRGVITTSTFTDIGKDAIDVNGSVLRTEGSVFERIGDRAVVAGKASRVDAVGHRLSDCNYGFVAKDGTQFRVSDSVFDRITQSTLMAYHTRTEFGAASLAAQNIEYEPSPLALMVYGDSHLVVNGAAQAPY